jgi:hypothetical protein
MGCGFGCVIKDCDGPKQYEKQSTNTAAMLLLMGHSGFEGRVVWDAYAIIVMEGDGAGLLTRL